MSPEQFLWVVGAVILAVGIFQARGIVRVVARAERPSREDLSSATRVFSCGFRGHLPSLFSASYPLGKFLVTKDALILRSPVIGDFALRRDQVTSVSWGRNGLFFSKLKIVASEESSIVFVPLRSRSDVRQELERRSWTLDV